MTAKLTILHLSDLHYSAEKRSDLQIIIGALLKDIQNLSAEGINPDIIIFTGDLVHPGSEETLFAEAKKDFIDPLLEVSNVLPENFFLVPGNHDINQPLALSPGYVEAGLSQSLTSVQTVNDFIDQTLEEHAAHHAALSRLDNYENFVQENFVNSAIRL